MAEESFGFTKNTEAISRRDSFSGTLDEVLQAPGQRKGNGYLQKKSSTGRYNKRWFVVHGHYLSYFRHDPTNEKKKEPLGALDLWHVEGVALDDNVITIRLSPHASQARVEEMGGETAKKLIAANPLAKNLAKRVDNLRRGASHSFTLKAATAAEAQAWLARMRESPLMGSLAQLQKSLQADNVLVARELRFHMPPKREYTFTDVSNMFDGVTDILLRNVPITGTVVSVGVATAGDENKPMVEGSALFEPLLTESAGHVMLTLPAGLLVKVEWSRKFAPNTEKAGIVAVAFIVVFLVILILSRSLIAGLILGGICAGGAAGLIIQKEKKTNDIVIRGVTVIKAQATSQAPASPPSSPKSSKGKKAKQPVKLGISTDPNVTPEEAGMIEILRERCKDMWNPSPHADEFAKKHEKFFREWHADVSALKNPEVLKTVMDKHIMEDFRCVRFLRARKHNVDKAEQMIRDSLIWRVVLGSDRIADDPELQNPPEWLLNYFGSPRNLRVIKSQEDRLANLYGRDKEGHLSIFIRAGRLTSRKIFKKMCSKPCFMVKYLVRTVEIMRLDLEKYRDKTNGKIETVISVVFDLDGFAVSEQLPIGDLVGLARRFFPIFATAFPELLHRVLVFNAPWLFGTLWSAVKPFIPEEVQEKIQIHSGEIKYDKHIRPYFDAQYVPKYFGGSMVDEEDGNEFCTKRVIPYGPYALPNEGIQLLEGTDPQAQKW